ncbi:sensor histidine kinase [Streptomyces spiramyceticus]|uniref:sensor histidine kinase n=1 Tax=Streptomyces spiramyceticus TaxID=299717 RepID=UPI00237B641E|nr:histidine kinase [Streptomyces spiramyceticus]
MRGEPFLRQRSTRDHIVDLVLWVVLCLPGLMMSHDTDGASWPMVVAGVVALGVAVLLCRDRPLISLGIAAAFSLALNVELFTAGHLLALVVFGYLSGRRTALARPALLTFAAIATAGLAVVLAVGATLWEWFTLVVTLLFAAVVPYLFGRYVRQYAELVSAGWQLADRMEREQRAVADRERLRERSRIAGDMHDSLGHDLALIAVRAAALEVAPALGEREQAAAGELREATASATARLRDIIGVLRADGEAAPTAPTGEAVGAVVERARDSGMAVELTDEGPPVLPPMTDRAVHRVVQEALTNAAKHAPGARVAVRLTRDGGEDGDSGRDAYGRTGGAFVTVSVANAPRPGGPLPCPAPGSGTGLVSLDERVRLAGGTLAHGPTPGGGFAVTARLPLAPSATPTPSAAAPEAPTSARELDRARQRVRRGLMHAILAPLAAVVALGILMGLFALYSQSRAVLDRDDYDRIRVGDTRTDVMTRLPRRSLDGAPDGVGPEPAGADDCEYFRVARYDATPVYRLCFTDGVLSSKSIAEDVDNEENR